MKNKIKNIKELWELIDSGTTVYWGHEGYKVYVETAIPDNDYQKNHFTFRDGKLLSIRYISNYFGGLIAESEMSKLFVLAEKPYVSSIIQPYGDTDKVKQDVKVLTDIFDRQGAKLLIDVIAEKIATAVNNFKLEQDSKQKIIESLILQLTESLNERV